MLKRVMSGVFNVLEDLITGGYLGQAILATIVWGSIGFLAINQRAIPDPLLDAGFIILGFYFRAVVTVKSGGST